MDEAQIVGIVISHFFWFIPMMILIAVLKSPGFKGWFGESAVKLQSRLFLPKNQYHAFHDITLPTPDGTTQIDHIFVSQFGIFVVETKNMKGWIFGNERQAQWTQSIYKKKYRFQNPLRQNFKHVKALESSLELPEEAFHSVVVFVGDSAFKTTVPNNVIRGGHLVSYIKSYQRPCLSEEQVNEAAKRIGTDRLASTRETHQHHIANLRSRSDTASSRRCPKCGSEMILRTTKKGKNAGNQFWGCSAFPQCRGITNSNS